MNNIINVTYVSVWDGGVKIESEAKYDTKNNIVFDIEVVEVGNLDLEVLNREYIELDDGTELEVELGDDNKYRVFEKTILK